MYGIPIAIGLPMRTMPSIFLPLLLVLGSSVGAAEGPVAASRFQTTSIPLAPGPRISLRIKNPFGPVRVRPSEGTSIKVKAFSPTHSPAMVRVEWPSSSAVDIWTEPQPPGTTNESLDTIEILRRATTRLNERPKSYRDLDLALVVFVPRTMLAQLEIESDHGISLQDLLDTDEAARSRVITLQSEGNATISCGRVCGDLRIHGAGGIIALDRVIGHVQVRASSARTTHTNSIADAYIRTVTGPIEAFANVGDFVGRSSIADVTVEDQSEGGVDVGSTSGKIRLSNPRAYWEKVVSPLGRDQRTRVRLVHATDSALIKDSCMRALVDRVTRR